MYDGVRHEDGTNFTSFNATALWSTTYDPFLLLYKLTAFTFVAALATKESYRVLSLFAQQKV